MERLDAIGDGELRKTLLFVRGQSRPVSANDVASALAVPRTTARWRLEKLLDAGLLVAGFERRSGRSGPGGGRPSKTYAPAPETTQLEFPRRRYETLLTLLLCALPHRRRSSELERVGAAFGHELADTARLRRGTAVQPALERVCRSLGELGFHAALESVTPTEAVIRSATCPLRPLVTSDAEARAIDQGMWRGLIATALDRHRADSVVCQTEGCDDHDAPCRIIVRLATHA